LISRSAREHKVATQFAPVFRALKPGNPISVEAGSTRVNAESYRPASMVVQHFAARGPEIQSNNGHTGAPRGGVAGVVEKRLICAASK